MNDPYAPIEQAIAGRKRPLVVGINGAYTSGKTVFAEGLHEYLRQKGHKTQLLHYDDFHNPFPAIEWTEDTQVEAFYNRAFTPDVLVREVLAPVKLHGRIKKDLACVNLGTGDYTNMVHLDIDDSTIVLLEGVLLFRPPLLDYLDYKVYLDISSDEILRRGRLRDVPKFGEMIMDLFVKRYIPVQNRYMREWNPIAQADLAIDNNDYANPRIIR